ncbi:MAG: hypothetical protein IJH37_09940 [Clostridia bacterium]|nr:hypothetical protein [Clostridia bacterium]
MLGAMLIVFGAAGFSATLGWIVYDIVRTKGLYKNHVSRKKSSEHVLPDTTEMYEGIRIIEKGSLQH